MNSLKITRPSQIDGIQAFLRRYIKNTDQLFEAIAEKAAIKLGVGNISTLKVSATFDVDVEFSITDRGYELYTETVGTELYTHIQSAIALLIVEASRRSDSGDVTADVKVNPRARELTIVITVDYLPAPAPALE